MSVIIKNKLLIFVFALSLCVITAYYYIFCVIMYYRDLEVPINLSNEAQIFINHNIDIHGNAKNSKYIYNSISLTKKLIASTKLVEKLYEDIDNDLLETTLSNNSNQRDESASIIYECNICSDNTENSRCITIYHAGNPNVKIIYRKIFKKNEDAGAFYYSILLFKGKYPSEHKYINGYINKEGCVEGVYDETNGYCMILSCNDINTYSFIISHKIRILPFLKYGI